MKSGSKIFIEYKYLLGVCACLRQADLSIDRCRWTSWEEVQTFYQGETDMERFFNFIIEVCERYNLSAKYHELNTGLTLLGYATNGFLYSVFKKKPYLSMQELETGAYLFREFMAMLRDKSPDSRHIELIRLRIANYYAGVLLRKLKRRDMDSVLMIKHYLQNERLKTLSLKEIVGY